MVQSVGSRGVYEYITQYDSTGYNGYATEDCIVVHWWGDPSTNPSFDGVVASLMGQREASAHYVLESGKVACLIAPGLRAWHVARNDFQRVMVGIYDINSHSIGIECNPRMTAGDIETLCQLIADLWVDYGKVPVYGHKDFMATQCPGVYYDKLDYIRSRAEEIYNAILSGDDSGTDTNAGSDEEAEEMAIKDTPEWKWLETLYANAQKTEASNWALTAMQQAVADGVTDGQRPQAPATREEVAIMVDRALSKAKG